MRHTIPPKKSISQLCLSHILLHINSFYFLCVLLFCLVGNDFKDLFFIIITFFNLNDKCHLHSKCSHSNSIHVCEVKTFSFNIFRKCFLAQFTSTSHSMRCSKEFINIPSISHLKFFSTSIIRFLCNTL